MEKKIYKYISPDIIEKIFIEGLVNLKCSFPKDYNDPYELFLSIDPQGVKLHHIVYYHEIVSQIPQLPTTCFSLSPSIVPMWAHYAGDHSGFVIEVDETRLNTKFPQTQIQDIVYSEKTGSIDMGSIKYAGQSLF